MNYSLSNGLFYLESEHGVYIPCMNEESDGSLCFDNIVSPFLSKEIIGDFSIEAKIEPYNMSLGDEYGIYAYEEEEKYAYAKLVSGMNGNEIQSGGRDLFKVENPAVNIKSESTYLKVIKSGDVFSMLYSENGNEYIELGKMILDDSIFFNVGFKLSSFGGSQFYIKVSDIKVD